MADLGLWLVSAVAMYEGSYLEHLDVSYLSRVLRMSSEGISSYQWSPCMVVWHGVHCILDTSKLITFSRHAVFFLSRKDRLHKIMMTGVNKGS